MAWILLKMHFLAEGILPDSLVAATKLQEGRPVRGGLPAIEGNSWIYGAFRHERAAPLRKSVRDDAGKKFFGAVGLRAVKELLLGRVLKNESFFHK